jgi:phosphocarrier protein
LWTLSHYAIIISELFPSILRLNIITYGGIKMVRQKVVIKNPTGLHLRPAGILCKEAMQFKSLITFSFKESTANAKSVLSVLGACVKCGDEVEFVCEGEDEEEALAALVNAIESGLGE